jgi:hypothetical protein
MGQQSLKVVAAALHQQSRRKEEEQEGRPGRNHGLEDERHVSPGRTYLLS